MKDKKVDGFLEDDEFSNFEDYDFLSDGRKMFSEIKIFEMGVVVLNLEIIDRGIFIELIIGVLFDSKIDISIIDIDNEEVILIEDLDNLDY